MPWGAYFCRVLGHGPVLAQPNWRINGSNNSKSATELDQGCCSTSQIIILVIEKSPVHTWASERHGCPNKPSLSPNTTVDGRRSGLSALGGIIGHREPLPGPQSTSGVPVRCRDLSPLLRPQFTAGKTPDFEHLVSANGKCERHRT